MKPHTCHHHRSAAASSEALAAAESRVEELLDEKADLEYDIDVLERKVELLREEVGCADCSLGGWWGGCEGRHRTRMFVPACGTHLMVSVRAAMHFAMPACA